MHIAAGPRRGLAYAIGAVQTGQPVRVALLLHLLADDFSRGARVQSYPASARFVALQI